MFLFPPPPNSLDNMAKKGVCCSLTLSYVTTSPNEHILKSDFTKE